MKKASHSQIYILNHELLKPKNSTDSHNEQKLSGL